MKKITIFSFALTLLALLTQCIVADEQKTILEELKQNASEFAVGGRENIKENLSTGVPPAAIVSEFAIGGRENIKDDENE